MTGQVEVLDAIAPIEAEWDALVDRTHLSPFVRPGWIEAWWSAWGTGRLELLTLRRAGQLCGIVPLSRGRHSLHSTTNEHTPDFGLIAEDSDAARGLATALLGRRERLINLSHLDGENGDGETLRAASTETGRLLLVTTLARAPFVPLDDTLEHYERRLARKALHNLRRQRRRLEEKGTVTLDIVQGDDRLAEALDEGFGIESSGWKAKRGTAIVSDPRARAFYTAVARWAVARGTLRLCFLRLDGHPLAFQYGLEEAGAYYFIKGGFDPAYAEFSPGQVLMHAMIEHYTRAGLTRIELLGTEERWKSVWARASHERVLVHALPASLLGFLQRSALLLYLHHARPLAKRALRRLRKR